MWPLELFIGVHSSSQDGTRELEVQFTLIHDHCLYMQMHFAKSFLPSVSFFNKKLFLMMTPHPLFHCIPPFSGKFFNFLITTPVIYSTTCHCKSSVPNCLVYIKNIEHYHIWWKMLKSTMKRYYEFTVTHKWSDLETYVCESWTVERYMERYTER